MDNKTVQGRSYKLKLVLSEQLEWNGHSRRKCLETAHLISRVPYTPDMDEI